MNQALAAKGMLVAGLATLSLGLAGCGNQYGDLEGEIETIGSESTEMISTESTDITEAGTEEVIELEGDVVYEPDSEF